jgi:hypothetical protein
VVLTRLEAAVPRILADIMSTESDRAKFMAVFADEEQGDLSGQLRAARAEIARLRALGVSPAVLK